MSDPYNNTISIFIIDPYALIRAGLKFVVEAEPGMAVVGEAGNAAEGLEMVACQKPDIVLLKLSVSGDLGLGIIPKLLNSWNKARIILLITTEDFQTCLQAVQHGVLGIVPMAQPPQILFKAIQKVYKGEVWIERTMMADLLNSIAFPHRPSTTNPDADHINQLSDRELQVIQLIGAGLKNKQIASQLCISEATVRHHLTSIFDKLGVSDRLELLVFANRFGLTKP